ncbi:MAG: GGDEF domain-containing protein [Oscillospiraceae bacterium]
MKKDKSSSVIWYTCLIIAFVVLLYSAANSVIENIAIDNESLQPFNTGWEVYKDGVPLGKMDLPCTIDYKRNTVLTLTHHIPADLKQNSTLLFRSAQSYVRVSVDGEELHSFGYNSKQSFSSSPGSAWQITRIPTNDFGDTLKIELTSPYDDFSGALNPVYIGTKAAIVFYLTKLQAPQLITSILMLLCGIVMLALYALTKGAQMYTPLMYLGSFSMILSVWTLGESKMLQMFVGNNFVLTNMAFIAMFLMPIPFLQFVNTFNVFKKDNVICIAIMYFGALFVAANLLVVLGICDYITLLLPFHLGIILCGIFIMARLIRNCPRNKTRGIFTLTISFGIWFLFILAGIYAFFFGNSQYSSLYISFGFLAFIIIVGTWSASRALHNYSEHIEQATLAALAYTDILTKLPNRTAFEDCLASYSYERNGAVLLMFDLNDLKYINDTYSHRAGDAALVLAARLLQESFAPIGKCYRIGGDEFCVIGDKAKAELIESCQSSLIARLDEANSSRTTPLSIAFGSAIYYNNGDNIEDAFNEADKEMYKCKSIMKG